MPATNKERYAQTAQRVAALITVYNAGRKLTERDEYAVIFWTHAAFIASSDAQALALFDKNMALADAAMESSAKARRKKHTAQKPAAQKPAQPSGLRDTLAAAARKIGAEAAHEGLATARKAAGHLKRFLAKPG